MKVRIKKIGPENRIKICFHGTEIRISVPVNFGTRTRDSYENLNRNPEKAKNLHLKSLKKT